MSSTRPPGDPRDAELLRQVLQAARSEEPSPELADRVLDGIEYRRRLEKLAASPERHRPRRLLLAGASGLAAAAAVALVARTWLVEPPPITPEPRPASPPSPAPAPSTPPTPPVDVCAEPVVATGNAPLVDDFEDGDDALAPFERRSGYWRWARETDAAGTAPALLPIPRPEPTRHNALALHVKGGRLLDWGAAVEVTFRPACLDASRYAGVSFEARGPGRIYFSPREASIIPVESGGTCTEDCHNPHVAKLDLTPRWQTYSVRWEDVRQRGIGKPPLDPRRLNSLAFLVRPEDTPYDVWLDSVRFIPR